MTVPDYPLLAPGGYEMYQLAQIATFIADRLALHRRSAKGLTGRADRAAAVRDLAGAATALDRVLGAQHPVPLPQPLDRNTYRQVAELVAEGPRTAHVVCLPDAGWAVVGTVPGIGAVGAAVPSSAVAEAVRMHPLQAPLDQLRPWAVLGAPAAVPTLPDRVDLAAFVERLDPRRDRDRAVAEALRGTGRNVDAAIRARFATTAPPRQPAPVPAPVMPQASRPGAPPRAPIGSPPTGRVASPRAQAAGRGSPREAPKRRQATARSVPSTSAGP